MKSFLKKPHLFDLFIVVFTLLCVAVFYFGLIRPVKFSGKIGRESVPVYGEIDLITGPELLWIKDKIPVGTQRSLVYGQLEWQVLETKILQTAGESYLIIRLKIRFSRAEDGHLWYQKYFIRVGDTLVLTNDEYTIRGWIYDYRTIDEPATF